MGSLSTVGLHWAYFPSALACIWTISGHEVLAVDVFVDRRAVGGIYLFLVASGSNWDLTAATTNTNELYHAQFNRHIGNLLDSRNMTRSNKALGLARDETDA